MTTTMLTIALIISIGLNIMLIRNMAKLRKKIMPQVNAALTHFDLWREGQRQAENRFFKEAEQFVQEHIEKMPAGELKEILLTFNSFDKDNN